MPNNKLPYAHFGVVSEKPVDWRRKPAESDPDDNEHKTPKDVKMMLGFDPAKYKHETKAANEPEKPLHERVYNNLTSVGLKREKSKQDKATGVWTHVFRKHTKFNNDNGNHLKTYMQRDGFTHEKTPLGHIFKQAGHHVELKSVVGGMKATYIHKDPSK